MCGLSGILNLEPGPPPGIEELSAMIRAIEHRGPDELGVFRAGPVGLAHARLAIIDIEGGRQPFSGAASAVWASYNGEIYNHVELRRELEKEGMAFRTRSDTEVLVRAYEAWGEACVTRLEGQFAFAIWDARRRRIFFGRDRLGVRPLYFARAGRRLAFASEIKALFTLPEVSREIDPRGLDDVFTFWAPLAPTTPFSAVRELPPGHVATAGPGRPLEERRYYDVAFPSARAEKASAHLEASVEALGGVLERATRKRLLCADVPVGCYLSGGLDSSVVAALARRAHGGRLRTFSIRFEDAEFDEGRYQREVAARLETDHEEIRVRRGDVAACFPSVVRHVERPVLRTAPAPLFLLSRAVQGAGIKVVLTGEGADEMLGGYDLFREDKVRRFWAKRPGSRLRPLLVDRLYPYLSRSPREAREMARHFFGSDLGDAGAFDFSHRPRFRSTSALKRLFSPRVRAELEGRDAVAELGASLPEGFSGWGPLSRAQYLEIRTLLSGYILAAQADRVGMAHAVEGRFPFLDGELMALAHAMPETHKLRVLDEKHVLKRAAAGLVPESVIARPKQPYRAPDAASFFGDGAPEYVREVLSERGIARAGLFDPAAVSRLVARASAAIGSGRALGNQDNMALVGVLSTELLFEELSMKRQAPGRAEVRIVFDGVSGGATAAAPGG